MKDLTNIIKDLGRNNAAVQLRALDTIVSLNNPIFTKPVMEILKSTNPELRSKAAIVLGKMKESDAVFSTN